jgi:ACR3 family arsenite efflux pump ArsB
MMLASLAVLLHGEGQDIIYFWASILMVALPLTIFSVLTWFVVKGSLNRKSR